MGYYTSFTVEIGNPLNIPQEKYDNDFKIINKFFLGFMYPNNDNSWSENLKWYNWQEEMAALTLQFPDYDFYIEGTGEENDDMWHAVVWRGHVYRKYAEIIYPELPKPWEETNENCSNN